MPAPGFTDENLRALARDQHLADAAGRPVYSAYTFRTGRIAELDRQFPSYLSAWEDGKLILHDRFATHFGYVHQGLAVVQWAGQSFTLWPGQFFVVPGGLTVEGGRGIVVTREAYKALPLMGGPLELTGRLKYIDGCTDSLLAAPVRRGDPCLNLLYFPAGIDQTAHTHPSDRIGLILSGHGRCLVGEGESEIDLVPGQIFCIHTGGRHKFQTPYGQDMRVLAYHPDSDFGPTDEEHPMINRTMVDVGGEQVSASKIPEIRTK
jgi:quercetin dioxygenase-like cupin family protein